MKQISSFILLLFPPLNKLVGFFFPLSRNHLQGPRPRSASDPSRKCTLLPPLPCFRKQQSSCGSEQKSQQGLSTVQTSLQMSIWVQPAAAARGAPRCLARAGCQEIPHSPRVICGVNMEVRGLFVLKGRWETVGDARASASHSCSLGVCPTHSREVGMVVPVSRGRHRGSGRWSDLPNPTSDPQVRSLC